jgi:Aspartyl/Asparaginyl beta-hydroxylase
MHQSWFPDRLCLPIEFDPARLAVAMADFSSVPWIEHFIKHDYEGDWSVIALRCPAGVTDPVQMIYSDPNRSDYADTPALANSPFFRQVLAAFACPLHSVRLMRLAPGSSIKEHQDYDLSFENGMVRMHIPVTTNAGVNFRLNGTCVAMPAGSCWYLRLSDPHSVANRGASDRVHLVIDAVVNEWLAALFERVVSTGSGFDPDQGKSQNAVHSFS